MNSEQLTSFLFKNSWKVEKEIFDYKANKNFLFHGNLRFKFIDNLYLGKEYGLIQNGDQKIESSQTYFYRTKENQRIDVLFSDLSFFHSLNCSEYPNFYANHHCLNDLYKGHYQFDRESWKITWEVSGPSKNYTSVAIYSVNRSYSSQISEYP